MPDQLKSSTKDLFLHLLSILALYLSVGALIGLLFHYINVLLPDPLSYAHEYRSALDGIRWYTAALIVVFPVYLLTMWLIYRDIAIQPAKAELRVRKGLMHFTLFLAAVVIIGDLIALIYNFLGGELTARFALKVFAILATSTAVFGYYLWDLRRRDFRTDRRPQAAGCVAAGIVLVSVIAGFLIVGSPFHQRKVRFDERRVEHLQELQNRIVFNEWQQKSRLPSSFDELRDSISGFTPPRDPATGQPYEYRKTGALTFELCATFETDEQSSSFVKGVPRPSHPFGGPFNGNWDHGIGRTCFTRTIDPQLYRPEPASVKRPQ